MTSSEERYNENIRLWQVVYGLPKKQFDPTKIVAIKQCEKKGCAETANIHRHHRGHEYFLACIRPDDYAARYLEFNSEDLVYLCKRHHVMIHASYMPFIENFRKRSGVPKKRECEKLRKTLRGICDIFVNDGDEIPKKRRKNDRGKHRKRNSLH